MSQLGECEKMIDSLTGELEAFEELNDKKDIEIEECN